MITYNATGVISKIYAPQNFINDDGKEVLRVDFDLEYDHYENFKGEPMTSVMRLSAYRRKAQEIQRMGVGSEVSVDFQIVAQEWATKSENAIIKESKMNNLYVRKISDNRDYGLDIDEWRKSVAMGLEPS